MNREQKTTLPNEKQTTKVQLAKKEFEWVIKNYLFPLFDIRGKIKYREAESENSELISYSEEESGNVLRFYPFIGTNRIPSPFYFEVGTYSSPSLKKSATCIFRELLKVMEYSFSGGSVHKQRDYGQKKVRQESYKKRVLDLALERGICLSLSGTEENTCILHSIICRMIEWAGRTYEGKNVPFGIVVDFDVDAGEDTVNYLHFLENDSSAVFADGIFSGILLDKHGSLLSFLTRKTRPLFTADENEVFVPYQFFDVAQHCINNAIGIIVQTSGEILLIKNRALHFAKRGSKWVSFDWTRVYLNLRPYFLNFSSTTNEKETAQRIKCIYCTMLDVSFSHTGGCLAIVSPSTDENKINKIIKDRFDLSVKGAVPDEISAESKEKIEILKYLLSTPEHSIKSFFEIDKPLRKEILSLDGATVLSPDGMFYCAGSIVALSGGSSGGGRTAAAKELAEIGVGIKISEDGYIEAYGIPLGKNAKGRFRQLFKIK